MAWMWRRHSLALRVGVLVANQLEYAEAEFGVTKAGAARVPMLTAATAPEAANWRRSWSR